MQTSKIQATIRDLKWCHLDTQMADLDRGRQRVMVQPGRAYVLL